MSKIIYLDTETTGLDKDKNDIIQVAGIIEINGVQKEGFNILCQPFDYTSISPEALKIQNRTVVDLQSYNPPQRGYEEFIKILSKYVDKFDRQDKFYLAGQNIKFDLDFLHSWAKKCGDVYLGSFFWWYTIDLLGIVAALRAWKFFPQTSDLKLATICKALDVQLSDAHDALNDIDATRACLKKIQEQYIKFPEPEKESFLDTDTEELPF